jgi:fibronectin-binding autotransporter adhesin
VQGSTATLEISDSTLSGNTAGNVAGAVYNIGQGGDTTVDIRNSTLSGNSSSVGGGIYSTAYDEGTAILEVSNSTLSGNSASFGGGIFNDLAPTLIIKDSTFSDNSADFGGGIENAGEMVSIGNTALKAGALGANIHNNFGTVTSFGYNLSSDDGGGYLTGPGDQINTDPLLGPLEDNGGPTLTHALLPRSPAIDAGDPNFTPPPFYDQRGPGFQPCRERSHRYRFVRGAGAHAQRREAQSGGNKYGASDLERSDLGQHRRLPRWRADRDNGKRWFLCRFDRRHRPGSLQVSGV